ncbi:MAG: hypothetical protein FJX77_10405 [Armatimonadetes bacterium]|nr:hypothetical protein [Armatimonadota bacterium]
MPLLSRRGLGTGVAGVSLAGLLGRQATAAQEQPGARVDPRTLWEGSLERLAGRYVFFQIASPGGLWEYYNPKVGEATERQVSLNELPAAFRDQLKAAEIVISDLKLPTRVEGNTRESPSGRGRLRFYTETTTGRISVKNLPGVGLDPKAAGFQGMAAFRLDHQSHSNPSVPGVLFQRQNQERTWGAATLDFADLNAETLVPADKPDAEPQVLLANARTLRSALEIFAFVEWVVTEAEGERKFVGSARLVKAGRPAAGGAA